jgi:excisionase family DNA binding protein
MAEHFTTSDVARELRVSESTVRQLERTGKLSATRTGTGIRVFKPDDVHRLATERSERRGR